VTASATLSGRAGEYSKEDEDRVKSVSMGGSQERAGKRTTRGLPNGHKSRSLSLQYNICVFSAQSRKLLGQVHRLLGSGFLAGYSPAWELGSRTEY